MQRLRTLSAPLRGYGLLWPPLAVLAAGVACLVSGHWSQGLTLAAVALLGSATMAVGVLFHLRRCLKSLRFRRPQSADERQLEALGQAWLSQVADQELRLILVESDYLNGLTLRLGPRYVLLTTPWLKNPAAAMAVLAHEVGHAAPEARPRRLRVWSTWAVDLSALASAVWLLNGAGLWATPLLVVVAYAVDFVSKGLISCPESRRCEYAADAVAAQLAGFEIVQPLLEWQAAVERGAPARSWRKRFLSRHPSSQARAQAIARLGDLLADPLAA